MLKRKIGMLMVGLLLGTVLLTGCGTSDGDSNSNNNGNDGGKEYLIGINQLVEHPALDDAKKGFEDGLEELGVNAKIDYQNAQGDIPTTTTISQKFVKDGMDLIYAIATPAAQSAKQATDEIPVLFSAVTDPVQAEIVDDWDQVGGNITGTSDMAEYVEEQVKMFKQIDPSIEKIGILYNTSEANSGVQIETIEKLAPEEGLEVITAGVSNVNELTQAIDSLIGKVDAVYNLSDNLIATSVELVSSKLIENNMVSVSAEESQVAGGILITKGLSYYELGKQTARMAKEILVDGKDPSSMPVEKADKAELIVNQDTLEALELDKELLIFKDAKMIEK